MNSPYNGEFKITQQYKGIHIKDLILLELLIKTFILLSMVLLNSQVGILIRLVGWDIILELKKAVQNDVIISPI